ncbi:hypothetical protein MOQ72_41840 [Saccharopolyspora sp. K220]|uniref:hypothetical protein n=1 Tax=Saccharopolyspora soli TaxID=2926618 RepID=UPI001F5AAF19|nr:hypothetical protein [Saccharopolyspora soli]MCI2423961.1 hypothetical protein [Saccharopolyspora soli]
MTLSDLAPIALLGLGGYLATCLVWPYKACRTCRGHGQLRARLIGIRYCPTCSGTGLRERAGHRAITAARRGWRRRNRRR